MWLLARAILRLARSRRHEKQSHTHTDSVKRVALELQDVRLRDAIFLQLVNINEGVLDLEARRVSECDEGRCWSVLPHLSVIIAGD